MAIKLPKMPTLPNVPRTPEECAQWGQRLTVHLQQMYRTLVAGIEGVTVSAGGAPGNAEYVVASADATLSAERVATDTATVDVDTGTAGQMKWNVIPAGIAGTPAIVFGTAYAAGVAGTFVRTDATLKYPSDLMSVANAFRLSLTDNGTDMTLTGSGGLLNIRPGTGIFIDFPASTAGVLILSPDAVTASAILMSAQGQPVAGTRKLISANWFGGGAGTFSGQVFSCWDAQFSGFAAGIATSCVYAAIDVSAFSINPSATSGADNKAYAYRAPSVTIASANGSWAEVAAMYLNGPKRLVASYKADILATLILEAPTGANKKQDGTTDLDQITLLLRQQTAQGTAPTNKIGLEILAQNAGTNRYSGRFFNTLQLTNPNAIAQNVLELKQLNTGAAAGAHINFDDKAGDPPSPNAGDLWRNGASLNYRKDGSTTVDIMAFDRITINGVAVVDADFRDNIPAALANYINGSWQKDTSSPANVTVCLPEGGTFHVVTKDLGTSRRSGTFDITGLSGLNAGATVRIMQADNPIGSKGDATDESEFDQIQVVGKAIDATTIRAHWWAPGVVVGDYNFAYSVASN